MFKHRGFPSGIKQTKIHFTIRRQNKVAPAKIFKRERFSDRRQSDSKADQIFLSYLYAYFGDKPFIRGNLDAGRINWLFEREVKSFDNDFDPQSYDSMFILDIHQIKKNFSEIIK